MSYIDNQLQSRGVSFDKILEDLMLIISPTYMKTPEMKEEHYMIPTRQDDTYDYCEIPFSRRIITNIFDAVPAKSTYADFKGLRTAICNNDAEPTVDRFVFAWHGRHIMVNNTNSDEVIKIKFAEVPKDVTSIHEDMYRALKHCYYYSMMEDWNGLYTSIKNLSEVKYNMVQKNLHTEKNRRTQQYFTIKPYKI